VHGGVVADHLLGELDLQLLGLLSQDLHDPPACGVLAEAGRDPAIHPDLRPGRDHVDLA